jgi:hypothetical protein
MLVPLSCGANPFQATKAGPLIGYFSSLGTPFAELVESYEPICHAFFCWSPEHFDQIDQTSNPQFGLSMTRADLMAWARLISRTRFPD